MNYIGDTPRLKTSFYSITGELVDPTTVTFKIKPPQGELVTATYAGGQVKKESTGVYYLDYPITESGIHEYRTEATGTLVKVSQGNFVVEQENV
jgi:hypothetical protein